MVLTDDMRSWAHRVRAQWARRSTVMNQSSVNSSGSKHRTDTGGKHRADTAGRPTVPVGRTGRRMYHPPGAHRAD